MITRLKLSTIEQGLPKYRSMLAGNDAFIPTSFESIATATGTGSSGTITFSSIPSTFQHLQIRGIGRTSAAATFSDLLIRCNSDTGSNYAYHQLRGNGASATATGSSSQTSMTIFNCITGSSTSANILGGIILDFLDYASTTKNKTLRSFTGEDQNTTNGNILLTSGLWISTAAVNSISLIAGGSGNWTTQTTFALYGIKG